MATHKLGKLKIKTSEDGIAFRFGEGKIHRLGLKRKAGDAAPDYDNEEELEGGEGYEEEFYAPEERYDSQEDYAPEEDYAPRGYTGRFAQPSGGRDAYEDDYDKDDRYDGDYDDGYDDYADDGRYADGDDRYYDDGEYAEDGEYDDRYSDEDAGDYGDAPYADESPILRYIDENDWVTYVLLVLLPPLGIYLLWRRRRFEMPIRWAVSGASGVWFVILLILLISALVSGGGDTTTTPPITMTTPTPTAAAEVSPSPSASAGISLGDLTSMSPDATGTEGGIAPAQTMDALAPDATATPIAAMNNNGGGSAAQNTVVTTTTDLYFHKNASCSKIEAGAAVSNVTRSVALQQGKSECPVCYPGQTNYYATATGKYYHVTSDCSRMKDASAITKEAAESQGKKPCPVCITKELLSLYDDELKFVGPNDSDKSGMQVYATRSGRYFHTNSTCTGMSNASQGGLLQALRAGKTACPTCAADLAVKVWCTKGGKRYHNRSDCDGMEGAYQVSAAEAVVMGKTRCTLCWGKSGSGTGTGSTGSGPYVWGTKNGNYYHSNETCSGMKGAVRVPLSTMISLGRRACPTCCAGADRVVYATKNGTYYHSYATCSDMKDAQSGTLAQAMALGKKRCPECWANSGTGTGEGSTASGTYVYATKAGTYYHTKSNCSGMSGASRVTLATAVSAGKRACPTCASAASRMVYSTDGGTYYHSKSSCSGMKGAKQRTLEAAILLGQRACPVCIGTSSSGTSNSTAGTGTTGVKPNMTSSGRYKAGTSGIKVYAVADGKHYHTTSNCSGMKNASHVTLETALNYGKTACPKCASSANTTVYAVKGGKYYHYSKTCAGSGAVAGKRGPALALGLDPCPYCVTKTKAVKSTDRYKAGTSGIKVYASVTGKHYHASKSCAGSSASRIALETALNYGKTPCPSCASSAGKTVYGSELDKYYHTSKTHAGADAVAGDFAKALALGKKECPVCIGGSESYEISDIKYSAPGDTKVYIDVDSEMLYYHKNSRCSDAGLSGGTGVTLDFVVGWGFKACPFCNPPTSVK